MKMINNRVNLYIDEKIIRDFDLIAKNLGYSRNELVYLIIQRNLGNKVKIRNEPDIYYVDKFLKLLIDEHFKKWDTLVKQIFKSIQTLGYQFYHEIREDHEVASFISRQVESNYKKYIAGEKTEPLYWKMVHRLADNEDE